MTKVKKFGFDEVKNGTLKEAEYKKELVDRLGDMAKMHKDVATVTEFFFHFGQKFEGDDKNKGLLCALGECKTDLKNYVRQQVATDKKNWLLGACFLEKKGEKEYVLQIIPRKGALSLGKINKSGKTLFNKLGLTVAIPKGYENENEDGPTPIDDEDDNKNNNNNNNDKPNPKPKEDKNPLEVAMEQLTDRRNFLVRTANGLKDQKDINLARKNVYDIYAGLELFNAEITAFKAMPGDKAAYQDRITAYEKLANDLQTQVVDKQKPVIELANVMKGQFEQLNAMLKQLGLEPIAI